MLLVCLLNIYGMDLYMMEKPSIIWITVASSGIGYALSAKLLAEGNIVIATARHGDKLQTLKGNYAEKLHIYQLDVTDEIGVKEFCLQITEKFNHIDTMILNAGICEYINWPDFDLKILHRNMNTNFWGIANRNCIAYGIKALQGSANPYIVGMASSAAIIGLPRAEGYGSSKAAVRYLLQCLQVQYYNSNITISIVTPGFVKTELTSKKDETYYCGAYWRYGFHEDGLVSGLHVTALLDSIASMEISGLRSQKQ